MTRWAPALVGALLVLAGCGSLVPDGEPERPTETVTPAPVTEAEQTATPTATPSLAEFPGVANDGRVDGRALYESHRRYLANRSYTLFRSRSATGGEGAVGASRVERTLVANDTTFLRISAGGRVPGTRVAYADPSGLYARTVMSNGTAETTVDGPPSGSVRERFAGAVFYETDSLFASGATAVDVVERDGRRYARLFTQRTPPRLERIFDAYDVRNFSATLYAASEGYVRAVYYRYDLHGDGDRVRVEWDVRYEAVGETTVSEPNWVRALQAGEEATVTGTPEADLPTVENETVGPPANATVVPSENLTATPPTNESLRG